MLGGALAAATAAVAGSAPVFAQQMQRYMPPGVAPKPKGPIVFLDYDQEELDAAYDQAPWAANQAAIERRNAQKNAAAIARLGPPRRLAYGPTEIERLDLFVTRQPNAPINVFVHGGAWRAGSASSVAYKSETFVDAGAHFIAPDFNNAIETNGDLMTMAEQVRRAVTWVYRNAASFGGDSNRLYISGFSSGAHLAAVVLTTDWRAAGLPADMVKGALCCSGVYDLHPVSLSARSSYVNLTKQVVEALSPQRHLDMLRAPVIVAHGTLETPEFQRQNREFAAAIKAAGKPVTFRAATFRGCAPPPGFVLSPPAEAAIRARKKTAIIIDIAPTGTSSTPMPGSPPSSIQECKRPDGMRPPGLSPVTPRAS